MKLIHIPTGPSVLPLCCRWRRHGFWLVLEDPRAGMCDRRPPRLQRAQGRCRRWRADTEQLGNVGRALVPGAVQVHQERLAGPGSARACGRAELAGGAGHGHALSGTGLGSLLSLAGPLPGQPPGVDPLLRGPLVKEYGVVLGGARDAADLRHVLRPLDLPKADAPPVLGR